MTHLSVCVCFQRIATQRQVVFRANFNVSLAHDCKQKK